MGILCDILVGGFNPSEKYSSVGVTIPNILKNKKMFQTTNQYKLGAASACLSVV
jgi:hypothetical protein